MNFDRILDTSLIIFLIGFLVFVLIATSCTQPPMKADDKPIITEEEWQEQDHRIDEYMQELYIDPLLEYYIENDTIYRSK